MLLKAQHPKSISRSQLWINCTRLDIKIIVKSLISSDKQAYPEFTENKTKAGFPTPGHLDVF